MNTKQQEKMSVEYIEAGRFERNPHNRVIPEEAVAEMKKSIAALGILQPITARPLPGKLGAEKRYEIVMGECRWRGAMQLGTDYQVPCFIVELDDKETAKRLAVENFQRRDLDPIEEAEAIAHMRETGWELEEIAESIGRTTKNLYKSMALLKLDGESREAVSGRRISIDVGQALSRLEDDERAAALKAVTEPETRGFPLPQREALELIQRQWIEPRKRAEEWEGRRPALEAEFPGAEWMTYQAMVAMKRWDSDYAEADCPPGTHLLSAAAREGDRPLPTWGDLAARHGMAAKIGTRPGCEDACLWVATTPLVDAEKAACAGRPEECIFPIRGDERPGESDDAAEARVMEEKRRREERRKQLDAMEGERKGFAERIAGGKLSAVEARRLALWVLDELVLDDAMDGLTGRPEVLGLGPVDDEEQRIEDVNSELKKRASAKGADAFAELGRAVALDAVLRAPVNGAEIKEWFARKILTDAKYPALREEHGSKAGEEGAA